MAIWKYVDSPQPGVLTGYLIQHWNDEADEEQEKQLKAIGREVFHSVVEHGKSLEQSYVATAVVAGRHPEFAFFQNWTPTIVQ